MIPKARLSLADETSPAHTQTITLHMTVCSLSTLDAGQLLAGLIFTTFGVSISDDFESGSTNRTDVVRINLTRAFA
jgi:hypothetical protein